MLNAHDVNTCPLTSRERKFGSSSCSSKMTCLLSIGGDRSYHFWAVVVAIWYSCWSMLILPAPFMGTKCGNSVPSFIPWKWGRKKVGRSQEWRKGGKEARRKRGKKEELPSLCIYSIRFERLAQQIRVWEQLLCVVSPLIFTFPRVVSGYVERLSLAINLPINIYFPKEVIHTSNGEESAYANY